MDVFLFFAIPIVGPLVVGVVLDGIFGSWARWWRWWYVPLVAGIPGAIVCVGAAVTKEAEGDFSWELMVLIAGLFYVLFPVAGGAVGVGLRRWVARSAASGR